MAERNLNELPPDLPVPEDDGQAAHLLGRELPPVELATTSGATINLADAGAGTLVLYVYPRTGVPGEPLPPGWDDIPGARGCTPQNCAFRDRQEAFRDLGAVVYGLSAQSPAEQREFAERERIPYPLLNDSDLVLARELRLPRFDAGGLRLYKRLTLIAARARIEHVIYPVFPPGADADQVLVWLRHRIETRG